MIIALMLVGYAAAKLNDDGNATIETTRGETGAAPHCARAPSAAEDPDCMLGADAWVALPPAHPAC
jgi:hypothetical protein